MKSCRPLTQLSFQAHPAKIKWLCTFIFQWSTKLICLRLNVFNVCLRSQGGSEVDFLLFLIEESVSYQENFFRNEKIVFPANLKNTYNYIACANFDRDNTKINLNWNSCSFWYRDLKLGSYLLGTITKLLIVDLGPRSGNFEFWKFQICIFSQI